MKGKCILCLEEKELTIEHVVPESLGGDLELPALCKKCNSDMGDKVDGPFLNSFEMELPRFVYGIESKNKRVPNPFGNPGNANDGNRFVFNENMKPCLLPNIIKKDLGNEGTKVHIELDAKDKNKMPDMVKKIVQRILKEKHPDMPMEEVNKIADDASQKAIENSAKKYIQPELKWPINVDRQVWVLEYTKIAYEIAFQRFGYPYVEESNSAKILRGFLSEQLLKDIRGQVPCEPISELLDPKKHFIVIIGGVCFIGIFGLWGSIVFEESNSRFMLPNRAAILHEFDPIEKKHVEHYLTV